MKQRFISLEEFINENILNEQFEYKVSYYYTKEDGWEFWDEDSNQISEQDAIKLLKITPLQFTKWKNKTLSSNSYMYWGTITKSSIRK
jgi:hypothetical protein